MSDREHISGTTRPIFTKFLRILPVVVARSSSGSVAIRYVLSVFLNDVRFFLQWAIWRHVGTVAATPLQRREQTNALAAWCWLRSVLDDDGRQD